MYWSRSEGDRRGSVHAQPAAVDSRREASTSTDHLVSVTDKTTSTTGSCSETADRHRYSQNQLYQHLSRLQKLRQVAEYCSRVDQPPIHLSWPNPTRPDWRIVHYLDLPTLHSFYIVCTGHFFYVNHRCRPKPRTERWTRADIRTQDQVLKAQSTESWMVIWSRGTTTELPPGEWL